MEYRSTEINADKPLSLNLPKCGPERNAIESFDIASNKNEEEKYLKILATPQYELEREWKKLREENQEPIDRNKALAKLLKCHPFPRYQGPFNSDITGQVYNDSWTLMSEISISGPASRMNTSIMLTCQSSKCVIMCPCTVCNKPQPLCSTICR